MLTSLEIPAVRFLSSNVADIIHRLANNMPSTQVRLFENRFNRINLAEPVRDFRFTGLLVADFVFHDSCHGLCKYSQKSRKVHSVAHRLAILNNSALNGKTVRQQAWKDAYQGASQLLENEDNEDLRDVLIVLNAFAKSMETDTTFYLQALFKFNPVMVPVLANKLIELITEAPFKTSGTSNSEVQPQRLCA